MECDLYILFKLKLTGIKHTLSGISINLDKNRSQRNYRIFNNAEYLFTASMTITGNNTETGANNNSNNQQALSKKAFLGSNTSIGRSSRDGNIPVRAVSPRVRWVEDKTTNEHYGSQQMSTSQQNVSKYFKAIINIYP